MADADATLKMLVDIGVVGKSDLEAVNDLLGKTADNVEKTDKAQQNLNESVPEGWEAFKKYKGVLGETGESTKHLHEHSRELSMMFRIIGRETCPELGEALHATHMVEGLGAIGIVIGLVMAYKIWTDRVKELTTTLSEVPLGNLTESLDLAKQTGEAWRGIKDAVDKAYDSYEKYSSLFERAKSGEEKLHDLNKKSLDLQKERALANLDLIKGTMTDAQYAADRNQIDIAFNDRQAKEDVRHQDALMAAQYAEKANAESQSKQKALEASQIKLPATDEAAQAVIDAQKERLKSAKDNITKFTKSIEEFVRPEDTLEGLARYNINKAGYQKWAQGQMGAKAVMDSELAEAKTKAVTIQNEINRLDLLLKHRKELQQQSADAAGEATTLGLGMGQARTDWQTERSFTLGAAGAKDQTDTTKMVGTLTKGGVSMGSLVELMLMGGQLSQENLGMIHQAVTTQNSLLTQQRNVLAQQQQQLDQHRAELDSLHTGVAH